jgi:hypothetical protein
MEYILPIPGFYAVNIICIFYVPLTDEKLEIKKLFPYN